MRLVSLRDFATYPDGEIGLRQLIRNPKISLYCLDSDASHAIFVNGPGAEELSAAPFCYLTQYRRSQYLYKVPIPIARQWAEEVGDWWERLILVFSVGRCGSTLLSRMLNHVPDCLSLSEPDVFTQLLDWPWRDEEAVPLLRSITRLLCWPALKRQPSGFAIKFRSMGIETADWMRQAFPQAKMLFLYRNAEDFVTSAMRAFCYFPSPIWAYDHFCRSLGLRDVFAYFFDRNFGRLSRHAPLLRQYSPSELVRMGPVAYLTLSWLSGMERYLQLNSANQSMLAVRFEDLRAQPEQVFKAIFHYCDFAADGEKLALRALRKDAQKGTIMARNCCRNTAR